MSPRLVLVGAVVAAIGGGLVAPALADTSQPSGEKVCLQQRTLLPNGYCIVVDNPLGAPPS